MDNPIKVWMIWGLPPAIQKVSNGDESKWKSQKGTWVMCWGEVARMNKNLRDVTIPISNRCAISNPFLTGNARLY